MLLSDIDQCYQGSHLLLSLKTKAKMLQECLMFHLVTSQKEILNHLVFMMNQVLTMLQ